MFSVWQNQGDWWEPVLSLHTCFILQHLKQSSHTVASFPWPNGTAKTVVNKIDFFMAYINHLSLELLALIKTLIKPENTATPVALSTNYTLSHSPCPSFQRRGTGLLIFNKWRFTLLLLPTNYDTFEYYAIAVMAPVNIYVVVGKL